MPDRSIYTNYVNAHLSIDKLDGTNYDTWALYIKLWLKSQAYVNGLTRPNVAENEVSCWLKIDAQLCIVIKYTIQSSLKKIIVPMRHVHKFGNKQNYYTSMILNVFMVCPNLLTAVAPKRLDSTMAEYLGNHHAFLHNFKELLAPAPTPSRELEQRSKFFMLLGLHGLSDDYSHVRDQILGSPIVSNFTSICSTLL